MSLPDEKTLVFPHRRWLLIQQEYIMTLSAAAKSSAVYFFCALIIVAALVLVLRDRVDLVRQAAPWLIGVPVLYLLTIPLTIRVNRMPPIKTQSSKTQLWLQTILVLIIIALAIYRHMILFAPHVPQIPVLYPLAYDSIYFLGVSNRPPGNLVSVPILYILIPALLLFLTGARWREMGLGRGYNTWRVALLWSAIPVLGFLYLLYQGAVASLLQFLQHLLRAVLQNSISEEFLYRGVLMSRLRYLMRDDWAIVLSTLIYGLSFIGVQAGVTGGDWIAALASTVLVQATTGLGMAVMYQRTRNLLASSIFHVALDMYNAFA